MTVPPEDQEFQRLFQEGDVAHQRAREALKNNPHKPTPWEDITPTQLKPAIKHLHREFETRKWQLSMMVECGCYLGLHPQLIPQPKFKGGLENLIPKRRRVEWQRKYTGVTESITFKFWSDEFSESLAELIVEPFNAFLKIGLAQKPVLSLPPIEWAKALTDDLIYSLEWTVPHLVKDMCDEQQQMRTDELTTENFGAYCAWVYWRTPKFVHMQPSGNTPYYPATAWEREEDAETTERLLQSLTRRMLDSARFKLSKLVGETHVSMASTPPLPTPPAEEGIPKDAALDRNTAAAKNLPSALKKPEFPGGPEETEQMPREFDPSDDYRHLVFRGTPYSLTRKQAQVVKLLHQAAKAGHPDVGKDRILSSIESETSAMKSIFKKSRLWKTLVISRSRGTYRLDISEAGSENTR